MIRMTGFWVSVAAFALSACGDPSGPAERTAPDTQAGAVPPHASGAAGPLTQLVRAVA